MGTKSRSKAASSSFTSTSSISPKRESVTAKLILKSFRISPCPAIVLLLAISLQSCSDGGSYVVDSVGENDRALVGAWVGGRKIAKPVGATVSLVAERTWAPSSSLLLESNMNPPTTPNTRTSKANRIPLMIHVVLLFFLFGLFSSTSLTDPARTLLRPFLVLVVVVLFAWLASSLRADILGSSAGMSLSTMRLLLP